MNQVRAGYKDLVDISQQPALQRLRDPTVSRRGPGNFALEDLSCKEGYNVTPVIMCMDKIDLSFFDDPQNSFQGSQKKLLVPIDSVIATFSTPG